MPQIPWHLFFLLFYLLSVHLFAVAITVLDKRNARIGKRRVKEKNAVAYGFARRKFEHVYLYAYHTPQNKKIKVYAGVAADYAAADGFAFEYMAGGALMEAL